jgi:chemotaxis family two-component system response regulator Rcp1
MTSIKLPIDILLAEDNPGDVRLTQEAFKDAKFLNNLYVTSDGLETMAFLRKQGKYEKMPRPDLILLDLNMPKMDGREVLSQVKSDLKLKHIPVIILTTSDSESDIVNSYNLHANCYITKPVDLDKFLTIVKQIENFWVTVVKLPPKMEN